MSVRFLEQVYGYGPRFHDMIHFLSLSQVCAIVVSSYSFFLLEQMRKPILDASNGPFFEISCKIFQSTSFAASSIPFVWYPLSSAALVGSAGRQLSFVFSPHLTIHQDRKGEFLVLSLRLGEWGLVNN